VWGVRRHLEHAHSGELHGTSEGNAGFCNILNKDKTIGTTLVRVKLVFDCLHKD